MSSSSTSPPPRGPTPPTRWCNEDGVRTLFGDRVATPRIARRSLVLRERSARRWVSHVRSHEGPPRLALAALAATQWEGLLDEVVALAERFNRSGDATGLVPGDYLEVVAVRW